MLSADCAGALEWGTDGLAVGSWPADDVSTRGAAECPVEPVADGVRADGLAMCAISRKGPTKLPVTSTANTITAAATAPNSAAGRRIARRRGCRRAGRTRCRAGRRPD
ncbi:MAG: hypothetical protein WBF20_07350, partial [Trebonia sp.]|uniref:hypothetical protein n=1 Tax=Trebonia sp. TaxID=2767075 RepID=UPI003BAE72C9